MENNNENLKISNSENSSFFEQKVSSSNGNEGCCPTLRFPNFTKDWSFYKAEKLFENIAEKNHPNITVLTIIQGKGTIPRSASGRKIQYEKESLTNYKKVNKNDFIIHLRSFEGGLEIANSEGIVSPAYTILRNKQEIAPLFYNAYFHTNKFINSNLSKTVEGIRDGRQISYNAFRWLPIPYPGINEQQKIANFLSLIDKRIEKQRQLVESLKKYKRGLISKIFEQSCKNGEIVKLEAIGNFYNGLSGKNKDDFGIGDDIFITYMNVYKNVVADSNMCDKVKIKTNESQNEVQYGDILFTQSSETLEEVGFSSVWLSKQTAYLNSFCFGFRLLDLDKVDPVFISYYMRTNNIRKLIMREGQGATRVNLSSERLKQIKIELPKINIQKQIANIMLKTDERINMSKEIVFALTNMKQGLLQQMFI